MKLLRLSLALCLTASSLLVISGATEPARQTEGIGEDAEAQALVKEILSQQPLEESVVYGILRLRDGKGKRSEIPLKYSVVIGDHGSKGMYEVKATPRNPAELLVIEYRGNRPNNYKRYALDSSFRPTGEPKTVQGKEAYIPFANTDYWLADLGLEFLHWPRQRLVRDAKITMRSSRPCQVLESVNIEPVTGGYLRVISWIDNDYGFPVYAEAYGLDGKLMKIFSLKGFKKVRGRYEAKELEMLNTRTDSRTRIEFLFQTE